MIHHHPDRLCTDCKVEYEPTPHDIPADFPATANGKHILWKGAGCRKCHQTGYRGRSGIFELMVTTDGIRDDCVQRTNASAIRNRALKDGMLTLRQDGWRKVLKGITTIEEVARVTKGDIVALADEVKSA